MWDDVACEASDEIWTPSPVEGSAASHQVQLAAVVEQTSSVRCVASRTSKWYWLIVPIYLWPRFRAFTSQHCQIDALSAIAPVHFQQHIEREIAHKIDVGNLKPSCLSSFALHSRLAAFIIKKNFRHNSGPREKDDIEENLKFNACSFSSLKLAELPKNCIKFPSHL